MNSRPTIAAIKEEFSKLYSYQEKSSEFQNAKTIEELSKACFDLANTMINYNYPLAIKWYRYAAELGNPRAMYEISDLYTLGKAPSVTLQEKVYWAHKARDLHPLWSESGFLSDAVIIKSLQTVTQTSSKDFKGEKNPKIGKIDAHIALCHIRLQLFTETQDPQHIKALSDQLDAFDKAGTTGAFNTMATTLGSKKGIIDSASESQKASIAGFKKLRDKLKNYRPISKEKEDNTIPTAKQFANYAEEFKEHPILSAHFRILAANNYKRVEDAIAFQVVALRQLHTAHTLLLKSQQNTAAIIKNATDLSLKIVSLSSLVKSSSDNKADSKEGDRKEQDNKDRAFCLEAATKLARMLVQEVENQNIANIENLKNAILQLLHKIYEKDKEAAHDFIIQLILPAATNIISASPQQHEDIRKLVVTMIDEIAKQYSHQSAFPNLLMDITLNHKLGDFYAISGSCPQEIEHRQRALKIAKDDSTNSKDTDEYREAFIKSLTSVARIYSTKENATEEELKLAEKYFEDVIREGHTEGRLQLAALLGKKPANLTILKRRTDQFCKALKELNQKATTLKSDSKEATNPERTHNEFNLQDLNQRVWINAIHFYDQQTVNLDLDENNKELKKSFSEYFSTLCPYLDLTDDALLDSLGILFNDIDPKAREQAVSQLLAQKDMLFADKINKLRKILPDSSDNPLIEGLKGLATSAEEIAGITQILESAKNNAIAIEHEQFQLYKQAISRWINNTAKSTNLYQSQNRDAAFMMINSFVRFCNNNTSVELARFAKLELVKAWTKENSATGEFLLSKIKNIEAELAREAVRREKADSSAADSKDAPKETSLEALKKLRQEEIMHLSFALNQLHTTKETKETKGDLNKQTLLNAAELMKDVDVVQQCSVIAKRNAYFTSRQIDTTRVAHYLQQDEFFALQQTFKNASDKIDTLRKRKQEGSSEYITEAKIALSLGLKIAIMTQDLELASQQRILVNIDTIFAAHTETTQLIDRFATLPLQDTNAANHQDMVKLQKFASHCKSIQQKLAVAYSNPQLLNHSLDSIIVTHLSVEGLDQAHRDFYTDAIALSSSNCNFKEANVTSIANVLKLNVVKREEAQEEHSPATTPRQSVFFAAGAGRAGAVLAAQNAALTSVRKAT